MDLKYGEKVEINRSNECEELRKSILELVNQIPAKIEEITETRRLKWINTQMRNLVNEKKHVNSEKRAEDARKRSKEYYTTNKASVIERIERKRQKVREISRVDEVN